MSQAAVIKASAARISKKYLIIPILHALKGA